MGNKSSSKARVPPDSDTFSGSPGVINNQQTIAKSEDPTLGKKKSSKNLIEVLNTGPSLQGQNVLAAKRSSRALLSPASDNQLEINTNTGSVKREGDAISPGRLPGRADGLPTSSPTAASAANRPTSFYSNSPVTPTTYPPNHLSLPSPMTPSIASPTSTTTGKGGMFGKKSPAGPGNTGVPMTPAQIAQLRFNVEVTRACVKGDLATLQTLLKEPTNMQYFQINQVDKVCIFLILFFKTKMKSFFEPFY